MRSFIVTFIIYAPTTDELLYPSPTSIQTVQRPSHLELSNLISSVACFGEKSCPKAVSLGIIKPYLQCCMFRRKVTCLCDTLRSASKDIAHVQFVLTCLIIPCGNNCHQKKIFMLELVVGWMTWNIQLSTFLLTATWSLSLQRFVKIFAVYLCKHIFFKWSGAMVCIVMHRICNLSANVAGSTLSYIYEKS